MKKVLTTIGIVVFALVVLLGVMLCIGGESSLGIMFLILGVFGILDMVFLKNFKRIEKMKPTVNPPVAAKIENAPQIQKGKTKQNTKRSSPKQVKPPQTQAPARVGYRPADEKMKISAAEYIVIDVETTGLSPDDDRIIEVAAVKCENDRIVDSFHSLINPGRRIPSNVTKLTGIKNADVAGAPDMDTVAPELSEFIDNLPLVAHNANFDIKFIANAFKRAGISKGMLYIDTLVLARNAFPDMPNHKLSTLINELGLLDHEQEHRAMSDVEATQRLYTACKAKFARQ